MKRNLLSLALTLVAISATAQITREDSLNIPEAKVSQGALKPVKFSLNEDGTNFIQLTGLIQAQMRYNENNPGTTVNGTLKERTWDVGLRRVRFQLIAQLTDRVFFYAQFGQNNTSYLTSRKGGFFIHDALGEYAFVKKNLSIGMGLSSWMGPLRYSSPGVGSFMSMDGPMYQQTTNDLNDQFVRRLGVYAKGKLGKLDYRISVSKPFIVNPGNVTGASHQASVPLLGGTGTGLEYHHSTFSTQDPEPQVNSYLSYQFFDQESNLTPYNMSTYLGNKKVFNVGGGIQYQYNAMWHKQYNAATGEADTVGTALLIAGVDVFYDVPLNKDKGTAFSFYAAYMYSDYGPNYIRQLGVMNTGDPSPSAAATASGALPGSGGNAFAMNGSGNTYSGQLGYKLKNDLLGSYGTLMPYALFQATQYYNFSSPMFMYHIGVNWLLKGQNSKISIDYQDRPYFSRDLPSGNIHQTARRGMVVLQYQLSF